LNGTFFSGDYEVFSQLSGIPKSAAAYFLCRCSMIYTNKSNEATRNSSTRDLS